MEGGKRAPYDPLPRVQLRPKDILKWAVVKAGNVNLH
jgi:hypothetical protein